MIVLSSSENKVHNMEYADWISNDTTVRPDEYWQAVLNEQQWQAVRHCEGPLLVIAGAGAGKTRVLTFKIAYMLEHGWQPWQILALTFTNKSAREMSDRIAKMVGNERAKGLWSGTFHSIFARILRAEHHRIGIKRDFTIYDAADGRSLIKSIVKEMGLDDAVYKPATIAGRISAAKNRLLLPADYANDSNLLKYDDVNQIGETHRIYAAYWERCRTAGTLDFDDLLLYTFLLFNNDEEARERYARRFGYILVDEYQDTNFAQYKILELLTKENRNICVVGDDAQSIYGFRGARIENILRFNRQFAEALTVKLEQNYRSTQNIVNAANCIIRHNRSQIPKTVFSENAVGDALQVVETADQTEEALKVCGLIRNLQRNKGVGYEDMAVLYRTKAQSRSFEEVFRRYAIPYTLYGGNSFYDRKEIRDITGYFRLTVNPDDEEAFKRIVNYPSRGIGLTTLQKIILASREHGASLWDVADNPAAYGLKMNRGTIGRLETFCAMIQDFREKAAEWEACDLARYIMEKSGLQQALSSDTSDEGAERQQHANELLAGIAAYVKEVHEERGERALIGGFLAQMALMTDAAGAMQEGERGVALMTVHASKGLEFDTVFVTGMEDNVFPAQKSFFTPKEQEEERRLFYVAVTRAKMRCFLTYARSRFVYGKTEEAERSPFIDEIDDQYLGHEYSRRSFRSQSFSSSSQPAFSIGAGRSAMALAQRSLRKLSPAPHKAMTAETGSTLGVSDHAHEQESVCTRFGRIRVGTVISQSRFGQGRVVSIEGEGDNTMVVIQFEQVGRKKLLLKFARFSIVENYN